MSTHVFGPAFELPSLFAPTGAPLAGRPEERGAEASFALVRSGPPVPEEEVESHLEAVEITVRWGAQVLSVAHLAEGQTFAVGEGAEFVLPEDILGATRTPIVVARGGGSAVAVPAAARAVVRRRGGEAQAVAGGVEVPLEAGILVSFDLGGERADGTTGEPVTFEIAAVRAGKRVAPIGLVGALAGGAMGAIGLSFFGHAAVLASLAMFMPGMGVDDADAISRDQLLLMQKLITASADRELETPAQPETSGEEASGGGSTGGEPHAGESGAAGTTKPVTTNGHMAFKGQERESAISRKDMLQAAVDFGMIGLIASTPNDPNAPSSPWAEETYKGSDDRSAMGKLFGTDIGDAAGFGVGLWGTGEGGGGNGAGIGIDGVGNTVGGGGGGSGKWGYGKGDKDGIGNSRGKGTGAHTPKPPRMTPVDFKANGRLPAEVIQRIVRQNFGRFRLCYERGLRGNPGLSGRVATRFVIDRNGAVATSQDAGSDLPDQAVVGCVVSSFHSLSFPQPEGGVATVTYPLVFTPGE
jgi:hypothetical protein